MEAVLCQGCLEKEARIADLERRVAELERRNRQLAELVRQHLGELPPPPTTPARAAPEFTRPLPKKKSGKKRGGQQGHPPRLKQLLPPERVDLVVPFRPTRCDACGAALPEDAQPDDPAPTRHQCAELPPVRATITEYQGHFRTCNCGHVQHAAIPAALKAESVGPQLAALLSYLVGVHHVSKRGVEEIVEDVLGVPISLGKVSALEQEMSAALQAPFEEAVAEVRAAPVKHVDETGWKLAGVKRWLWAAATKSVAVFLIHARRNLTALGLLLGERIIGIVHSDRWRVYNAIPVTQRQLCWAHLRRNFEKKLEQGAEAKALAEVFLAIHDAVFQRWHLFRGGGCSREELADNMEPLAIAMHAMLSEGQAHGDEKTVRLCTALLQLEPALWTFVTEEGVEPTNNHGERVQRQAVLWRKCCFGCQSERGCRFVERLLTVVQTLRLQKRSVLSYLTEAIQAYRAGHQAPKLVAVG